MSLSIQSSISAAPTPLYAEASYAEGDEKAGCVLWVTGTPGVEGSSSWDSSVDTEEWAYQGRESKVIVVATLCFLIL